MAYPTALLDVMGLWTAWLMMMLSYSYPLWKENHGFRFAEFTFVSTMLAINLIVAISNVMRVAITPMTKGEWSYIIPIVLGFAMYTMLFSRYRWISRYPVAILVGIGFGLGMRGVLIPSVLTQVIATITPPKVGDPMSWLNFAYIAIGTICSVMYFLLTYEHKGVLRYPTRLGRWIIMIGLGAYFGNTILFRFSMLAGRAQFFLQVLKIIPL